MKKRGKYDVWWWRTILAMWVMVLALRVSLPQALSMLPIWVRQYCKTLGASHLFVDAMG